MSSKGTHISYSISCLFYTTNVKYVNSCLNLLNKYMPYMKQQQRKSTGGVEHCDKCGAIVR